MELKWRVGSSGIGYMSSCCDPWKRFNINGRLIPQMGIMVKKFGRKMVSSLVYLIDPSNPTLIPFPLSFFFFFFFFPDLVGIKAPFLLRVVHCFWIYLLNLFQDTLLCLIPPLSSMAAREFWQRAFQRFINRWLRYPTVSFIILLGSGEL